VNTWTVNTHRLAPKVEDDDSWRIRAFRTAGSRDTVRCLTIGQRDLARSVLFASFEKQLRLIGIRDVHLPRATTSARPHEGASA
jgi:hypothetical protein